MGDYFSSPGETQTQIQTQTQTQTQTHRHTDTETHRHTDTQTHRHTDTQTNNRGCAIMAACASIVHMIAVEMTLIATILAQGSIF